MCSCRSRVFNAIPSLYSLNVLLIPILRGPIHMLPLLYLALPGQNTLRPLRFFMVLSEQLSDCIYSILWLCLEIGTGLTIEERK